MHFVCLPSKLKHPNPRFSICVKQSKKWRHISQIWTYGLIIWWIERVSIWFIHHWITSIMTPCDVSFIIFGQLDWFHKNQSNWFPNIPIFQSVVSRAKQVDPNEPSWEIIHVDPIIKATADRKVLTKASLTSLLFFVRWASLWSQFFTHWLNIYRPHRFREIVHLVLSICLCVCLSVVISHHRTCWIYNLCGSIRIDKNQISGFDLKYGSIKIYADQCASIPINFDQ